MKERWREIVKNSLTSGIPCAYTPVGLSAVLDSEKKRSQNAHRNLALVAPSSTTVPASCPVPPFLHPHAAQAHDASLPGNTILAYPRALFVAARRASAAQLGNPNVPSSCPKCGHRMRGHIAQILLEDKCDTAIAIFNTNAGRAWRRADGRLLDD